MDNNLIKNVTEDFVRLVQEAIGDNVVQCRLFGSCARGDYDNASDIDIVIITKGNREEAESYTDLIIDIVAELAMKYEVVVNALCIPYDEYEEKKEWYDFYVNVEREGQRIYG